MADEIEGIEQPAKDLDTLFSELNVSLDKRFQGFQGIMDRRDAEYREMLEDQKLASLEPEEREQVQTSALQKKLDEAQRKLEILSMRKEYPEEVDLLTDLLEGKSMQDQLTLLAAFRKVKADEDSQGEPDAEQPTPVDKNNPSRKFEPSLADVSGKMNKALADKILGSGGNEPGLLRRLRGG